jgi:hypothetical protein
MYSEDIESSVHTGDITFERLHGNGQNLLLDLLRMVQYGASSGGCSHTSLIRAYLLGLDRTSDRSRRIGTIFFFPRCLPLTQYLRPANALQ